MATDKQQHQEEKAALIRQALPLKTILKSSVCEYKVVEVLGAGGFGITYKVVAAIQVGNVVVNTYFVIKEHFLKGCWRDKDKISVLYAPTMESDIKMSRNDFIEEAKRLNKLGKENPNIVKVNEAFEANDTAYYVMEYLDGGDLLHQVVRYGSLSERKAVELIVIVAKAVDLLHKHRLLHLDIKPDNIVLKTDPETGRQLPVLIDFGIAKHFDKSGKPTSHLVAKGASEGYAPMEQYDEITYFAPEIDVYALGATLYFLLTGKHPPKAFDIHSFNDLRGNLPLGISMQTVNALAAAMKPGKHERTQTVSAFIQDLDGGQITEKGDGTKLFHKEHPQPIVKKHLWVIVGVACAAVLIAWLLMRNLGPAPTKDDIVVADSTAVTMQKQDSVQSTTDCTWDRITKDTEKPATKEDIETQEKSSSVLPAIHQSDVASESTPVPIKVQRETEGELDLGYAVWTGGIKNQKPHGQGVMHFRSDYTEEGTELHEGYRIEGEYENGRLVIGQFYDATGTLFQTKVP